MRIFSYIWRHVEDKCIIQTGRKVPGLIRTANGLGHFRGVLYTYLRIFFLLLVLGLEEREWDR